MKVLRILWITNDLFEFLHPYVKGKPTRGGSWIEPLFNGIKDNPELRLGLLTPIIDGEFKKQTIDGVTHYSFNIRKGDNMKNMSEKSISSCLSAIEDFRPDVIHAHGIERNFGLLRKHINPRIPLICSIQGIVAPCRESLKYSISSLSLKKYRSLKNLLGKGGVKSALKTWKFYEPIEKEIFEINKYFIGRTEWDRAHVNFYNPKAYYYHGEELLRSIFYSSCWDINACEKHRIFISSSAYPLKGFHVLIKATNLLKEKYPDIKVVAPLSSIREKSSLFVDRLVSEDYSFFLKNEIKRLGLQKNIFLEKKLNAEEMVLQYQKAHVFALPSFMENSSNALGEAMMVGTPSVVTPVGGVMSIVKNDRSALVFPPGDYVMMANQIDRLFSEDQLALKISSNARAIALRRHDIRATTLQYIEIYKDVIKRHESEIKVKSK